MHIAGGSAQSCGWKKIKNHHGVWCVRCRWRWQQREETDQSIRRIKGSHLRIYHYLFPLLIPSTRPSSLPSPPPPPPPSPSCCAQTNGHPQSSVTTPSLMPSSLQRTSSITKNTPGSSGKLRRNASRIVSTTKSEEIESGSSARSRTLR